MSLSPRQLRQRFELLSVVHAFGGGKTSWSYERLTTFLSTAPPSFSVALDKLFGTPSATTSERVARLWGSHDRLSTPTVTDLLEALTLGAVPNTALSSLASPSPPRRALRSPFLAAPPPQPQVMPVRFTFVAENPGELGVERGETVEVVEGVDVGDIPAGWALVMKVGGGGERGFVPVDFLGAIGEGGVATATPEKEMAAIPSIPARAVEEEEEEEEEEGGRGEETVPLSSFAFLAHDFISEGPGEISVPQGELVHVEPPPKAHEEQWPEGWTFVAFAQTKGFVPTAFLIPALSVGADTTEAAAAAAAAAAGTAVTVEGCAQSTGDASTPLEAAVESTAPMPPTAPILPPLPTTTSTAAPASSRSSITAPPPPPPSAMTLPLQAPITASSYAQGYLDAMSRVLLEARLALKEAEIQGATSSISSNSSSSSFSSRTTYLASESRPATALSLPTFPSLRSSRVGGGISKGGVYDSSGSGGGSGGGSVLPPGVSAVIQWAAASGKDLLSATTASLAAHVALVGQLEGEAFKAYTLVQEGKAVGEEGRRKAPPPPHPPA